MIGPSGDSIAAPTESVTADRTSRELVTSAPELAARKKASAAAEAAPALPVRAAEVRALACGGSGGEAFTCYSFPFNF